MEEELEIILETESELDVELEDESALEVELENDVIEKITSDYEKLNNLPQINNIELKGNRTAKELKLQEEITDLTNSELEELLN